MFNFDGEKGNGINDQLHFGTFHDVILESFRAGGGPLGLWNAFENGINALPQDKHTVAVLDNISPMEIGLKAEAARDVGRYVKDYGLNLSNVTSGRFGGLSSVVNGLIADKVCVPLHNKGIRFIIVTAHIKPKWSTGGIVFNKYTAKGADRWQELSILSLVLVPGTNPPAPSAIVQKEQLGNISWNKETLKFTMQRTLPLRLPVAEAGAIYEYMANPADMKTPKEGEALIKDEFEMYSDDLSKEQIDMWSKTIDIAEKMRLEEELEEKETLAGIEKDMINRVKRMKLEDHKSSPQIAKELGIDIALVSNYLTQ
jgi:hypothetical protein